VRLFDKLVREKINAELDLVYAVSNLSSRYNKSGGIEGNKNFRIETLPMIYFKSDRFFASLHFLA
jgi:hypothetical protein